MPNPFAKRRGFFIVARYFSLVKGDIPLVLASFIGS